MSTSMPLLLIYRLLIFCEYVFNEACFRYEPIFCHALMIYYLYTLLTPLLYSLVRFDNFYTLNKIQSKDPFQPMCNPIIAVFYYDHKVLTCHPQNSALFLHDQDFIHLLFISIFYIFSNVTL